MPRKRKEDIEREMADGKLHKPQQRNAANARERSRMRVLSKAFTRLKTTLPWVPPDTKLSKLDTLRLASSYIAHLKQILDHEESMQAAGFIHPLNLTVSRFKAGDIFRSQPLPSKQTWPFTFSGRSFNNSQSNTTNNTSSNIMTTTNRDISSFSSADSDSQQVDRTTMTGHALASH